MNFFYCLYRYNKTVKINQLGSQQLSSSPRVSWLFPGACFRGSTQWKTYSKTFIISDFKVVLSRAYTRSTNRNTSIKKSFITSGPYFLRRFILWNLHSPFGNHSNHLAQFSSLSSGYFHVSCNAKFPLTLCLNMTTQRERFKGEILGLF